MAITRRQFLKRSGLATGSLLVPGWLDSVFVRKAMASAIGDRYLLVFFLDGGNDGLNTVVPVDNGSLPFPTGLRDLYQNVRGTGTGGLRIPDTDLLPIGTDPNSGTQLGLHPALSGFKSLYDGGRLAVIQGCGYPAPNLSHATSSGFWQTADRFGAIPGSPRGWMGRYLADVAGFSGADIPAVNVRSNIAGEFVQTSTNVLAFSSLSGFGFPFDTTVEGGGNTDKAFKQNAFAAVHTAAAADAAARMQYVGEAGAATLTASQVYPGLVAYYNGVAARNAFGTAYPNNGTGRSLRDIARIIYGVETGYDPSVCARYFEVRKGGYDTHADQGDGNAGRHFDLHKEVGDALKHFYDDVADMGIAHKLCVVLWSEFGRRVAQNATGTDHGTQAPMFVLGGTVNGGVYGNHPDIGGTEIPLVSGNTAYSQDNANPYRSTDLRDVFGTIAERWLNAPDASVLFPADTQPDPANYWTAANFNLGFLP